MRRPAADAGAVTAEFAVAVPTVILVLAAGIGAIGAATQLAGVQRAAGETARAQARGEPARTVAAAADGAAVEWRRRDGLLCAELADEVRVLGVGLPVTAAGCALDGGR